MAKIQVKEKVTTAWIDVHEGTPVKLLSYKACRDLALIPAKFPQPISQVIHARVHTSEKADGSEASTPQPPTSINTSPSTLSPPSSLPPPATNQTLPFTNNTTPAEAKAFFLREYGDVLMTKEDLQSSPLRPMKGPPMRIHLREDTRPFAIYTPRQIPLAFQDAVQQELQSMVAQGIIAPAGDDPFPWCHPLVAVQKPNGGVTITTDSSHLNKQVSRPAHPSPTPFAAIRSIDTQAHYFTTLDALRGYWQLELAEEDQPLNTFITPYGRFKYLRGPMGFAATGDAFCLSGDMALQGVPNCVKVVDDVLVHDRELLPHLHRINTILTRCRENGITLNADKFVLVVDSCCQLKVSASTLTKFVPLPTLQLRPTSPTFDLSFQLAELSPEIAAATQPLRPLMSPRPMFTWTADHDAAFRQVKDALASPPQLAMFDPHLPTTLQTDASRLSGIGYGLLQEHGEGRFRLVQCGSRFLSDTEPRYATIELEMLATVWAMQKCSFYLRGLHHFEHITDHIPLIPILNHYTLDAIENPRLQRLKQKLLPYVFTARWRAGKTLWLPDALSRHPVSYPSEDDKVLADISVKQTVAVRAMRSLTEAQPHSSSASADLKMEELQQTAQADDTYQRLLECVRHGFPRNRYNLHSTLLSYWKLREDLYCDDDILLHDPRVESLQHFARQCSPVCMIVTVESKLPNSALSK